MQGAGWETFVEVRDKWGLHEHRSLRSQSRWSVDNKTTTNWIVTAVYPPMRKTGWSVRQHVRGGLLVPSVKRGFRWQSCWGWGCIENSGLGRRAGGFGHQQWCHGRWWGPSQTLGRRISRPARALPVCPVVWWSLLTVFLRCPCDIGTVCEKYHSPSCWKHTDILLFHICWVLCLRILGDGLWQEWGLVWCSAGIVVLVKNQLLAGSWTEASCWLWLLFFATWASIWQRVLWSWRVGAVSWQGGGYVEEVLSCKWPTVTLAEFQWFQQIPGPAHVQGAGFEARGCGTLIPLVQKKL